MGRSFAVSTHCVGMFVFGMRGILLESVCEQMLLSNFCVRRDHKCLLHPHPFNVIFVFSKVES